MEWTNIFQRRTPNTRTCWGYSFEWTDEHVSPEETDHMKHTYDVLGEECLKRLNEISPPPRSALPRNNGLYAEKTAESTVDQEDAPPPAPRDLYILLRDNAEKDPKLRELWEEINTIPDWVDWKQIERGQDVFYRYGGANLTGLAYQSLLGGMGAARVVETLARTGGFSTKVARRRLYETTQHILQCTRSLSSIQPGGAGFASSVRVRLLHAAVRMRIMKLAADRPDYYKVDDWGVPINDLDSIGTIATFSSTLVWLSLPRQGLFLRKQEIEDYIALWRYVAYLVGCPHDSFSTPSKAKAIMESLLYYEIEPTKTGAILAQNIIASLSDNPPTYASASMLVASARWLNGEELCDRLGLIRPSLYYYMLMIGQCAFFCVMCYTYRSIPYLDRKKVATLKAVFYSFIVDSKFGLQGKETNFEFKYVPEYDILTDLGRRGDDVVGTRSVEWRNLKWACFAAVGLGVGLWGTVKVLGMAMRAVGIL
ncbi:hypothetical protein K402DRAFT_322482 [Aulographum hederae CBS 113979]|uniref:ER-bound oxygenase mpaB/mpaB'/Rubber oxygenase catalytic domain-containing protein n=1 Tax=Aulographum hederae CBS 113979 TaxID=1176131 RepID=A0A6G1HEN5_9PEZI|nr:hypothetical protein K402DRAFT_322482 [Aulographum hederae CBS 113979]